MAEPGDLAAENEKRKQMAYGGKYRIMTARESSFRLPLEVVPPGTVRRKTKVEVTRPVKQRIGKS